MRCSNSIKVDRCDFFEETCMAQNTENVVEKTCRRTAHVKSHPIIYRATKPPRLYPVTEKRMTWSPSHSRSLTVSVTLYLSILIIISSSQIAKTYLFRNPFASPIHSVIGRIFSYGFSLQYVKNCPI